MAAEASDSKSDWPRFDQIPEPRMVALYCANGSGTKVYQGFLDGHPQIYMLPVYPLMYLYPHWHQWEDELRDHWTWKSIVDVFCMKHASVLDTRRIPGNDGLTGLGKTQNEYISIDEALFRDFLEHMLEHEPVSARTFLLAVHYAYAFCRGENLSQKKVLVYHIHVHEYLPMYLFPDFPDALVLGTVRDPRSNIRGRYYNSEVSGDAAKLNKTDALIYRRRVYYFIMRYFYEGLDILWGYPAERVRMIRHEDLYYKPDQVLRATAEFIGIDDHPCMKQLTFGSLIWWGNLGRGTEPMNTVNPKVVSIEWQKQLDPLDWYVFEGLFAHYMKKYGYPLHKYKGTLMDRLLLFPAMLLPTKIEREVFKNYFRASYFKDFLRSLRNETKGIEPLKDYNFNAFYRHKWTQKDLHLQRARWYVEFLKATFKDKEHRQGSPAKRRTAEAVYVTVNLIRYALSILACPVMIFKRWRVTGAAYFRMIRGRNALPDALP